MERYASPAVLDVDGRLVALDVDLTIEVEVFGDPPQKVFSWGGTGQLANLERLPALLNGESVRLSLLGADYDVQVVVRSVDSAGCIELRGVGPAPSLAAWAA